MIIISLMPDLNGIPSFFLGANAPKGYYSRFDQLFSSSPEGKCFLLKGGPGTGKSTVLKKIAAVLKEIGLSTELIFCTADTDSLDAVITSDGEKEFEKINGALTDEEEDKVESSIKSLGESNRDYYEKNGIPYDASLFPDCEHCGHCHE